MDPVGAVLSGIESLLIRSILIYSVLGIGIALPFLVAGTDLYWVVWAGFAWPVTGVVGAAEWGMMKGPACLGAILLPIGILTSTWCFIADHRAKDSLWMTFSLAILLTAPAILESPRQWGLGISWGFLSLAYFGVPRLLRAKA